MLEEAYTLKATTILRVMGDNVNIIGQREAQ